MSTRFVSTVLALAASLSVAAGRYNILVLTPITSPSHTNVFKPLVRALAERGHRVTHWDGLGPSKDDQPNLRVLYSPVMADINSEHNVNFNDRDSPLSLLFRVPATVADYCRAIHEDPVFHELMSSGNEEKFDLILVDGFFNECTLLLAELFDVPFVYLNCFVPPPWLQNAIGTPFAFDHFPHSGLSLSDRMNFWQRMLNALTGVGLVAFHHMYVVPVIDGAAVKVLGLHNFTSIVDIEDRHLSLLLTNTHFSINYLMPTSPAVVQVGGMHCVPPKPLPAVKNDTSP